MIKICNGASSIGSALIFFFPFFCFFPELPIILEVFNCDYNFKLLKVFWSPSSHPHYLNNASLLQHFSDIASVNSVIFLCLCSKEYFYKCYQKVVCRVYETDINELHFCKESMLCALSLLPWSNSKDTFMLAEDFKKSLENYWILSALNLKSASCEFKYYSIECGRTFPSKGFLIELWWCYQIEVVKVSLL